MEVISSDIARGIEALVKIVFGLAVLGFVIWLICVGFWLGWVFLTRVFPVILLVAGVVFGILFILWALGRIVRALGR